MQVFMRAFVGAEGQTGGESGLDEEAASRVAQGVLFSGLFSSEWVCREFLKTTSFQMVTEALVADKERDGPITATRCTQELDERVQYFEAALFASTLMWWKIGQLVVSVALGVYAKLYERNGEGVDVFLPAKRCAIHIISNAVFGIIGAVGTINPLWGTKVYVLAAQKIVAWLDWSRFAPVSTSASLAAASGDASSLRTDGVTSEEKNLLEPILKAREENYRRTAAVFFELAKMQKVVKAN